MDKSFKLTCKNDVLDLIRDQEYQDRLWGLYDFSTYGSGHPQLQILSHDGYDVREDDVEFKISRRNSLNKSMLQTDTDAYAAFTAETLDRRIGAARASLQVRYDELLDKADEVQMELLYLMMLMRLRKRFDIEPVVHTSNQWVKKSDLGDSEYSFERSNTVFRMFYRVNVFKGLTYPYQLYWSVTVQSPALNTAESVADQEKKFRTKEEMQKYLDGRIKAYDKYFLDMNPAVPEQYLRNFTFAGQLLPGYRTV